MAHKALYEDVMKTFTQWIVEGRSFEFRQYIRESQELEELSYLNLIIKSNPFLNVPKDYELVRVTKDEALKLSDKIIFVKYFNEEFDDVFWYCSTSGDDGRNYYIPDNFILDGYSRSTREQCIRNGVDWICVN